MWLHFHWFQKRLFKCNLNLINIIKGAGFKETRDCHKVPEKAYIPGPGQYGRSTLEEPISSQKSFLNAKSSFGKDPREEVKLFSHEYKREYSNKIGPGPAAY